MVCAIMQPTYLPWLGYFDLIRNVDLFVIYDHVQFEKRSWQQRNKILLQGNELILTVPVISKSKYFQSIREVEIDETQHFVNKHLNSIKAAYSKSKNFNMIYGELTNIYKQNHKLLSEINLDLIDLGMRYLSIKSKLLFSSSLNIETQKVNALIDICKKIGANKYLSPVGSKIYIDENNIFPENNIELSYQKFSYPVYKQLNSKNFTSHLSFIDYLFNVDLVEASSFGSYKTNYKNE